MIPDWNDYVVAEGVPAAKAVIESSLSDVGNDQPTTLFAEVDDDLLNPPPVMAKEGFHGILLDIVNVACHT